jgi:hypothetical protein
VLPWHRISEADPDPVLSAGGNLDLPDGRCPLLVLPHGIGFRKQVPDSRSIRTLLSGPVPERLLPRTSLAAPHPDEVRHLAALGRRAAERAVELGDPCFARLRAGLGRRAAYRAALVAHPNVSSWHGTWQLDSLQSDAVAAGPVLVPPTAGRQAAVTAADDADADVIVSDHGSVTWYGAALGKPVLPAAVGSDVLPTGCRTSARAACVS